MVCTGRVTQEANRRTRPQPLKSYSSFILVSLGNIERYKFYRVNNLPPLKTRIRPKRLLWARPLRRLWKLHDLGCISHCITQVADLQPVMSFGAGEVKLREAPKDLVCWRLTGCRRPGCCQRKLFFPRARH